MIDLSKSNIEDLRAEFARLAEIVSQAEAERKVIHNEIETRQKNAAARVRLRALSHDDKEALKELLA